MIATRADIERDIVWKATYKAVESLKHIKHGGMDVIRSEVTSAVDDMEFDFSYSEIWGRVFRHVLVRLEDEKLLAHVLMI